MPVNNRRNFNILLIIEYVIAVIGDEIPFLYECTKLNDLRVKYKYSGIRLVPNVPKFVNMPQSSDSETI